MFGAVTKFRSREEAGRLLADALRPYVEQSAIVVALPRGGVPVGYEVARTFGVPLEVCVVRKIGVPWQPELGMGAVAEGGVVHLSRDTISVAGLSAAEVEAAIDAKRREVDARVRRFRGDRARTPLEGRTVILVDDGVATGGTARAAIASIRGDGPRRIVLAAPVAAPDTLAELAPYVDDTVVLLVPSALHAIGIWYDDFEQVSDEEVVRLLGRSRAERAA